MRRWLVVASLLLLVTAGVMGACGGSGTGPTPPPPPPPAANAPTVTSISPALGPAAGNIAVTVSGTNFSQGASLILGGTAATGVIVDNSTSIRATIAAHAAGVVEVAVRNSDGQTGTLPNSFSYWTLTANANPGSPYTAKQGVPTNVSGTGTSVPFTIANFRWDCGQATPRAPSNCVASGPTATWTYIKNGLTTTTATYTVTLTVTDSRGNTATATAPMTVSNAY